MNPFPWMPEFSEDRGFVLRSWIGGSVTDQRGSRGPATCGRAVGGAEKAAPVAGSHLGDRCLQSLGSLLIFVGGWLSQRAGATTAAAAPDNPLRTWGT